MENNELLNENKRIKYKLFKNNIYEKLRNFIGMIISFSKNDFQTILKPSDLMIKYEKKDTYYMNNYFKVFNISLNPKNILNSSDNFIKESQNIRKSFEKIISDKENDFDLDLSERFFKDQIFNFQDFIFKKEINNELIDYKLPDNKNNILFFVLRNNNENDKIKDNLDYILKNNKSFFYFEKVYVIKCHDQNNNNDLITLINNSNNLIEFLSFQENKNNIFFNHINIFESYMKNSYNYFFICNNEKKIIKIKNKICNNEDFILKLKHVFNKKEETKKNEFEELIIILNKFNSKNYFKYYTNLEILMECYYKFNDSLNNLNLYKIKHLTIKGSLRTNDYYLIKNKIDDFNFKNKIDSDLKEIETFTLSDIDFNKQILCKNCGELIITKLSDKNNETNPKGFYYCYWCKDFYCTKCVEEKLAINCTSNYQQKLIDKNHNLLYFCTTDKEDLKEFDKLKLGKNHYNSNSLNTISSWNQNHSYMCNGCRDSGNNIIRARYVCVSCRPGIYRSGGFVDYCFKCIEHLRNEDDVGKEIEKIEDEYYPKTHSHRHHVYFCVVFQMQDYQNY